LSTGDDSDGESKEDVRLPPVDEDVADKLFLPRDWLQHEVVDLLAEKRQVIFYGPPGTGKTLVAQRLAQDLTRYGGSWDLIQFHPSYSYEDFFEGYRPRREGDVLTYALTWGPLRRMADAATADPTQTYVLVVDEINRGNVAKIFGELLFLLEYRDRAIALQYSPDEQFSLPPNLLIIGTMNTADRSIALVDSALRRRFYFIEFSPSEPPIEGVLGNWLTEHHLEEEAARLLSELNRRLGSREFAIGPSYFMTADGSAPRLERTWKNSILPLLEEYFYSAETDVASEFGLGALRAGLTREPEPSDEEEDESQES
jgi:5-methylcytosine-specific restriction protein B